MAELLILRIQVSNDLLGFKSLLEGIRDHMLAFIHTHRTSAAEEPPVETCQNTHAR